MRLLSAAVPPAVVELLDTTMGSGYVSESDISAAVEQGLVATAFAADAIVGVALGRMPALADELAGLTETEIAEGPAGYFSTVAVRESWRRRGLGAALVSRIMSALREKGATRITVHIWNESPAPAFGIFESLGFRLRETHGTSGTGTARCAGIYARDAARTPARARR